ncbi:hypothetical protein IVB02_27725 [Bradyrhizobium sp. 166]|uniref:hypothetical protein n=1 Tax=Bradyrhizobium sp. 166 TaxID=2782638 RepID=UPI0031F606B4|nr:hypothetical protein [Bradyrhizobium sp. 166]
MTVWLQVQPEHPVARSERPAQATVLPWAPALGVPAELLPQAASVRAAEPRRCGRARGRRRRRGRWWSLRRLLRFSVRAGLLWLRLRDDKRRRALCMRCGACELHRGQSRGGKQHETKVGHVVNFPGRFFDEVFG